MHKLLHRPICHLTFDEANSIYEEIRRSQFLTAAQQPSVMRRQQEQSPYQNNLQAANLQLVHHNSQSQEKNFPQGMRMNRLNSMPQTPQHIIQQPQTVNVQNFHTPLTPALHNVPSQENSQRIVSKDSIIRKYDDFFGQKQNIDQLKEENSRLYYEKLALEASVQRLKDENVKKDNEISRLKEVIEHSNNASNKGPQLQLPLQKPLHGFHSQVTNQATSPQVHFRSNYEQKRPF